MSEIADGFVPDAVDDAARMVQLKIELGGGLENLFGNVKEHDVTVKGEQELVTLSDVILWSRDHILTERPELFMKDDSVRPGILVLVNDTDWELTGTLQTPVRQGDVVTFISTLHGG